MCFNDSVGFFYRTMTKISNRKTKPPKAVKPKTNDVKKDLTNVRVIQRKMAYVIGLPLSLADEDVCGSFTGLFSSSCVICHNKVSC